MARSCEAGALDAMRLLPRSTLSLLLPVSLPWSTCAAPLGEYFSPANADAYMEAAVRTLADAGTSVLDKDYAVQLLGALSQASVATGYKSSACSMAQAELSSGDLGRIHHGISLRAGVGCTGSIPEAISGVIENALQVHIMAAPLLSASLLVVKNCIGPIMLRRNLSRCHGLVCSLFLLHGWKFT